MKNHVRYYPTRSDDGSARKSGKPKRWLIIDNLLSELYGSKKAIFIDEIPNARDFRVSIQGLMTGDKRNVLGSIAFCKYTNLKFNRYWRHMLKRLMDETNSAKFWRIALLLIKKSTVFKILHLRKVLPQWYKAYPLWWVISKLKKVQKLIDTDETNVRIRRVYIPKGIKYRPLGVPEVEWRIYLSMWNTVLAIYLRDAWPENQSGFIPGRGTLTAWQRIIHRINEKNIWEFDFKQYFPNILLKVVEEQLLRLSVPIEITRILMKYVEAMPILKKVDKADESLIRARQSKLKAEFGLGSAKDMMRMARAWESQPPNVLSPGMPFPGLSGIGRETTKTWKVDINKPFGLGTAEEMMQMANRGMKTTLKERILGPGYEDNKTPLGQFGVVPHAGVAQGVPLSPIMSILPLIPWLFYHKQIEMYADDGLIISDDVATIVDLRHHPAIKWMGVEFSREKSQWIKQNNVWLKPLKFVGLEYDGNLNMIRSAARNQPAGEWHNLEELKKVLYESGRYYEWEESIESWQDLLCRDLSGWIISTLWNTEVEIDPIATKEFKWQRNSMIGYLKGRGYKIHLYNAGSLGAGHLASILRRKMKRARKLKVERRTT